MTYKVTVENGFTGRGPGGVAFADGTATGVGERILTWSVLMKYNKCCG